MTALKPWRLAFVSMTGAVRISCQRLSHLCGIGCHWSKVVLTMIYRPPGFPLSGPGDIVIVCTARHPARTQGIQPLVAAVHQAVRHSPASRANARHPAARRSRAASRLSQPGVPRARGIQSLVATVHPAVCHDRESCHHSVLQACVSSFSNPSGGTPGSMPMLPLSIPPLLC